MRKSFWLLAIVMLAFLGCNKETDNHLTTLVRPYSGSSLVCFADQTWDSIAFQTTESYRLVPNVAWCQIPSAYDHWDTPYSNALGYFVVPVQLDANPTGSARMALIEIQAGDYSVTASVYQYPFLNVTNPARSIYTGALLDLEVEANATSAEVSFNTFSSWTLAAKEGTWLHVESPNDAGPEGTHHLQLSVDANTTQEERRDTLLLTSRGVVDKIPVVQQK